MAVKRNQEAAGQRATHPRRRLWLGRVLAVRLRVGLLMLVVACLTLASRGLYAAVDAGTYEQSLVQVLSARGLHADPGSLLWLHEPSGPIGLGAVFFLAARGDEPPDLYFGYARTVASSAVLDVLFLSNLTHSSSAAEGRPVKVGSYLAFPVQLGDVYDAIVLLDLRGEPPKLTRGWSFLSKLQNNISNLQETGRFHGFGIRRYPFVPAPESLSLAVRGQRLHLRADGEEIIFDPSFELPVLGEQRVQLRPQTKGRPGRITWLVDTVRRLPFVGPEPIEWLEHTVFGATDQLNRWYHALVPADVEAEVRQAMPVSELSLDERARLDADVPTLGLPPPAIVPVLEQPVRGEGQWLPLVDDPFLNQNDHAPPAFFQTFVRVDPERDFARVYITLWDPRQVDLNLAMGTREPESATGETGAGQIPREPEVLERLVGAFNGGFQAMHGEFGMMADGRVYLPPKPFAATVAVYEDGRAALGSWPGPGPHEWDEEFANSQIPDGMTGLRQNLTSVVEDGVWNPWERWWWGAAPTWADEQTYIQRSGLCLTAGGFLAYFWGDSMGPEELGRAMSAADCARGMHLDMNSKHTGFEFIRPLPSATAEAEAPALRHAPSAAQFVGKVADIPGYRFRVRKAVTTMTPLRFPRYLGTDPRDFFYLTLRPVLPGPPLQIGQRQIPFEPEGLPHSAFPPAFARARLATTDGHGTWLLRIDPSRAVLEPAAAAQSGPGQRLAQLWIPESAASGSRALYSVRRRGRERFFVGLPVEGSRVWLRGQPLTPEGSRVALGVDGDGFLVYAEASPHDARHLPYRLLRAGAQEALALPDTTRLLFVGDGGWHGLDGRAVAAPEPQQAGTTLVFAAERRPRASVLFPEVQPRPYREWGRLQDRRVRYFPEGPPRFRVPEAELTP